MSEIILNWLNEEIQLSRRVNNFEEDFSNGYLFGELLQKYNQQLNFPQFLDKTDKKSKLKNFQLLFDTFTALGVTFDSNVAHNIITKKTGSAKKLLYELKMHLQKTKTSSIPAFNKITKTTKTLSPLKKLKISREQYDKVDKTHFIKQLNQLHPAQKTLNQQKLLKKFSDFHQQQIKKNRQVSEEEKKLQLSERKRFRDQQRDNLKKTADFRNEWQNTNRQKWSANMTVRKLQREKQTMYKSKLEQKKFQNKTMSELTALKALDKDISQFQKKIVRKVKPFPQSESSSKSSSEEKDDVAAQETIPKDSKLSSKLKFNKMEISSFNGTTNGYPPRKKGTQPQGSEHMRHQRQKKRRKMIVQQNKRYQLIEISRRQRYMISTIQQTSKQEKQIQYEVWRVWQNKQVIQQNKELLVAKEKEKAEVKQVNAQFKKKELLKTYREQHEAKVQEAVRRQSLLSKQQAVKDRKKTYRQCEKMVFSAIQIMQKCFLHQQQTNKTQLESDFFQPFLENFVEDKSTKEEIAELQLKNYIKGKGDWNFSVQNRGENQPSDPTLHEALPDQAVNNQVLGNILRQVYQHYCSAKDLSKKDEQAQNSQIVLQGKVKNIQSESIITLNGLNFAGKHLVASSLKEKFDFNVVEIGPLVQRKVSQYQSLSGQSISPISSQTRQLVDTVYAGKPLSDQLIIQILTEQLARNPRSVIVDFPTTSQQLLLLVKALTGIQPSDHQQPSLLNKKIKSFSRLVCPTQTRIFPRTIKECGIDLTVWINIQPRNSFDRALGRREVNGQIVHIGQNIADKVYELTSLGEASSQILQNHYKSIEKRKLKQFLQEFGIVVEPLIQVQNEKQVANQDNNKELQNETEKQFGQKNNQQQNKDQKEQFRQDSRGQNVNQNQKSNQRLQQGQLQRQMQHRKQNGDEVKGYQAKQSDKGQIQKGQNSQVGNQKESQAKLQGQTGQEKIIQKSWVQVDGNCTIEQLKSKVDQLVQKTIQLKEQKRLKQLKQKQTHQKQLQQQKKHLQQEQDILNNQCVLTIPQQLQSHLQKALSNNALSLQFVNKIVALWESTEASTVKALTNVFKHLAQLKQTQKQYLSGTKCNFMVNILARQDQKFQLVKDFQLQYNKFHDDHPDMVAQEYTKDELHQRVDDLQDQLYECIENKKDEALAQRQSFIESGWLQNQLEQLYNCLRILLQTELNRYNSSQRIISDYYGKNYSLSQEPFQLQTIQIPYDTSLELYNKQNNSFPRLEKLFSEAMRLFNRQEEQIEDKNKKGGKAPPKKDEKKGGKKGEVQEEKQPGPQEQEMKRALNVQKAIFRYRFNMLNNFGKQRLQKTISETQLFYKQLEEYSLYTFQVQNKAVENLSVILRRHIEEQRKVQHELQLDYVDIIETQQIRNFPEPQPIILPAVQKQSSDRLTIANLIYLIQLLNNESEAGQTISTKRLIVLLTRIQDQFVGEKLPEIWRQLKIEKFQKFLCLLDPQHSGLVELQKVLIFFVMSGFQVPTKKQLKEYFDSLTEYGTVNKVSKDKLIRTTAWFDQQYQTVPNTITFDRNARIKEILFSIFKVSNRSQEEYVDGQGFVKKLGLSWLNLSEQVQLYLDVIKRYSNEKNSN